MGELVAANVESRLRLERAPVTAGRRRAVSGERQAEAAGSPAANPRSEGSRQQAACSNLV